jgi:hypothetical protein
VIQRLIVGSMYSLLLLIPPIKIFLHF